MTLQPTGASAVAISAQQWSQIRALFGDVSHVTPSPRRGVPYCALGSVDEDGCPRVTPVGTLFLEEDMRGFYFELYSRRMAKNLDRNKRICALVVNTSMSLWGRALMKGRFRRPPAVRLMGIAGKRREATAAELDALREQTGRFRFLKAYPYM